MPRLLLPPLIALCALLAACEGVVPVDTEQRGNWGLSSPQGRLDADGRHVVVGRFCPPTDQPAGSVTGRFRAEIDSGAPLSARFDPPTATACTDVRITLEAPGFTGTTRLSLVAEFTGPAVPWSLVAPFELQGYVAPPTAGCGGPPPAGSAWQALAEPLALDARFDPALGLVDGVPVMVLLQDGALYTQVLDLAARRWGAPLRLYTTGSTAAFGQILGRGGAYDMAWTDQESGGTTQLRVFGWNATQRQFSDRRTLPLVLTRPRTLQVRRTAESLFAVAVDANTLAPRVWRAPQPAVGESGFVPVALPPEMADSGPYALATDVDAEGRLLIAFDRLVPGEAAVVSQVEVWRQVGESGFERLGPAVEAQRGRGAFDIPVIQDLALRATDPATGRALVLAWTQGNTADGQRVVDWRAGDAAWAPLGDWAAGVRTEPQPYGRSTQGRSLALDCSGQPVMGWFEAGSAYPTTLAWAAAWTGQGASGWQALPAIPPEALPSPGRLRLLDRPGQRPLALRWHLGGWGDTARVDVLGLAP